MLEGKVWRARLPNGTIKEYDFDSLMAATKTHEVTRDTPLSVPAFPEEFKPAGEIPSFWQKFGTRPWRVSVKGDEYTARGDNELREWAASGRVTPSTDVYDPVEEEWVKANSLNVLKGSFKSGCLSIFTLGVR